MNTNYKQLKQAHARLMSKYVDVLNELTTLPFFVPSKSVLKAYENAPAGGSADKQWRSNRLPNSIRLVLTHPSSIFSLRFLVRLFVESHIRRKLNELSVAYSYLAQKHLGNKSYTAWLRETSEDCKKLADTLTSLQSVRGIVSIWWPVLISIVTASLGLDTIYDLINRVQIERSGLILFGLLLVFPLIYLGIFVGSAFGSKRELFTPGFDSSDKPLDATRQAKISDVIYVCEDQVFQLTGRSKVREFPLDAMSYVAASFVFASVPILVWIADPSSPPGFIIWLSGAFFLILGIIFIFLGLRRKWR